MNRNLFRWLVAAAVLLAAASLLVAAFGIVRVGPLQGSRLKLLVLAGLTLLTGIGARYRGERIFQLLEWPNSRKALIGSAKQQLAGLWSAILSRKADAMIVVFLFCAAVVEVSLYVRAFLSSGVRGALVEAGSSDPLVISSTGFPRVPLAWLSTQISHLLSLFAPFVSPYGILFGITVILLYGIFRLGMGRILALLCTLSFMVSSLQLDHLIPFWDKYFVRAPFVFGIVLILGALVVKSFRPGGLIALSVAAGIVLGQGLMFRPDLVVFGVALAITLLFFLPPSTGTTRELKMTALFFFIAASIVSFSTCPQCTLERSANGHAFINGATPFFNDRLGLISPQYDWNYLFLDEFTSSMSFAQAKVFNEHVVYEGYGPVDEQVRRAVLNFPADALARFYGAAWRVMEIPFTYSLHPVGVSDQTVMSFYAARSRLLNGFSGSGLLLWGGALLMISYGSLRKGIFCLLLIPSLVLIAFVHLVGYYFFYLEFMTYWALGFVAQRGVSGVLRFSKDKNWAFHNWRMSPGAWWNPSLKKMTAFGLGTVLILSLPLFLLRQYQVSRVSGLVHQYQAAAVETVDLETVPAQNGKVLLTNPRLFKPVTSNGLRAEELMASFNRETCGCETVWVTLRYGGSSDRRMDFSRSMSIDLSSLDEGRKRLFFPALAQQNAMGTGYANYFSGIEISSEQAGCLEGLYRVKDLRQLDMLLTLQLPFRKESSYARWPDWLGTPNYTVPERMPAERVAKILSQPLKPIRAADADYRDPIFSFADGEEETSFHWKVNGHARDNSHLNPLFPINGPSWNLGKVSYVNADALLVDTDLMITKPGWHRKGSAFVARGTLYGGGVAFALLNENRPSGLVILTNPGAFDVILEAPKDGFYTVGLMNYLSYYNTMENRMTAKAGWVD